MQIGKKIRNAREDHDITQVQMAKMIPMNQSNYSKIENDSQEPSIEQFRRICQILHLNPSYLLQIEEYENITADDIEFLKEIKALVKKHSNN